jgi:hypothetical protein
VRILERINESYFYLEEFKKLNMKKKVKTNLETPESNAGHDFHLLCNETLGYVHIE